MMLGRPIPNYLSSVEEHSARVSLLELHDLMTTFLVEPDTMQAEGRDGISQAGMF